MNMHTLFLFMYKEEVLRMDAGPDSTRRIMKKFNMDCIKQ